jgi:hypothetical protein
MDGSRFPRKAHAHTGRLRSTGSADQRVPRLRRYCAALRLPRFVGRRFGSPCDCLPQLQVLVLGRGRARLQRRGTRRSFGCGFLPVPLLLRKAEGLSGYRTIRLPTRQGHTPRRMRCRLARERRQRCCLQDLRPPGHPGCNGFSRLSYPWLACLCTYASTDVLPQRLQGSLPTCRARRWSGGIRTHWMVTLNFGAYAPPFRPALPDRNVE